MGYLYGSSSPEPVDARVSRPLSRPMDRRSSGLVAMVLAASAATLVHAAPVSVTVPGAWENLEAGCTACQNAFPFGPLQTASPTMRYQQVYGALEFSTVAGPFLITDMWFRPDRINGNAFSSTLANVQIHLSTTDKPVNASTAATANSGLSLVFAENIGPDETLVHSGALSLSSQDLANGVAPDFSRVFDIGIQFTTPFLFNPDLGNLLLDVRNFGGGGAATTLDAASFFGDSVSRVFAPNVNATQAAVTGRNTLGLITRFTIHQVPEPGSLSLLLLGAATGMAVTMHRRRRDENCGRSAQVAA